MKKLLSNSLFRLFIAIVILASAVIVPSLGIYPPTQEVQASPSSPTTTYTSSTTWTCPTGVTSIMVEVWGAGGGGEGGFTYIIWTYGGSGAGGGAYSRLNSYAVTPGNNYTVTVGAAGTGGAYGNQGTSGGDSWFNSTGTVLAKGGNGGSSDNSGGQASAGVGDVKYSGGTGYMHTTNAQGGGGGGSAGSIANGGDGGLPTAGTAGNYEGGIGGTGGATNGNGNSPASGNGGGGGGGGYSGTRSGANGTGGKVKITELAWSGTTKVSASKDNHLLQEAPTVNQGTIDTMSTRNISGSNIRHSALEFNTTSIPTGATITSASLNVYYYLEAVATVSGKTVTAYKMMRTDWSETQSTWNIYKTGGNWTGYPNGPTSPNDYVTSSPSGGSAVLPSSVGWVSWSISAIVQNAVTAGISTEIILIQTSSTEGIPYYYTREATYNNPYLAITYTYKPSITTNTASSIGYTSAQLNGNVTDIGGSNVTAWGFKYNTTPSDSGATTIANSGNQSSPFTFGNTTGTLVSGQRYFYYAYATNTDGTTNGSWVQFQATPGQNWLTYSGTKFGYRNQLEIEAGSPTQQTLPWTWTTAGTYVWTCPTGNTTATVELWGGGGGGVTKGSGGGGGGGGGYSRSVVTVTPGGNYTVVVGAGGTVGNDGTGSTFGTTTVVAKGGDKAVEGIYGQGGAAGTGDTTYSGGDGAYGGAYGGGGGGSSAGTSANGNNAIQRAGGTAPTGGGKGGDGSNIDGDPAQAGSSPGGGGGGGYGAGAGGAGAAGKAVITFYKTPSVPSNYLMPVNVFKSSPSVEEGSWTVNGVACDTRVPFTINVYGALTNCPLQIIIDTKTLVTGGFFNGSTSGYAKVVEFADSDGTNPCYYWVTENGTGVPRDFNTSGTRYYVKYTLAGNTTYTKYMYIHTSQGSPSSKYSGANTFAFFEHFDTEAGNLTAFLANYNGDSNTAWETDPNAATVSVSSSVLTVTGLHSGQWDGIATSAFSLSNFTMLAGISSAPGDYMGVGITDTAGLGNQTTGHSGELFYCGPSYLHWYHYYGGTSDRPSWLLGDPSMTTPFYIEVDQSEGLYNGFLRQDGLFATPDTIVTGTVSSGSLSYNINHKIVVAGYETNSIYIDWIAAGPMPNITQPSLVSFPAITYEQNGSVFLNDRCLHFPYDLGFSVGDGNTSLYWHFDPLTELTKTPGDSIQATVQVTADLTYDQTIFIYYRHSSITSPSSYCSGSNTFSTFEDFTSTSNWTSLSGTWGNTSIQNPVLYHGDIGNTPGGAGRLWARQTNVVEWNGTYKMVYCVSPWEYATEYCPWPYRIYQSESSSPSDVFTPGRSIVNEMKLNGEPFYVSSMQVPFSVRAYGDKAYMMLPSFGTSLFYTSDFVNWTANPNFNLNSATWILANDPVNFPNIMANYSSTFVKSAGNSTYYIFYFGILSSAEDWTEYLDRIAWGYTTDAPENWTNTSFTYGGYFTWVTDVDDIDFAYDSEEELWYLVSYNGPPEYEPAYATTATFPTGWSAVSNISFTPPPYGAYGSSRMLVEGTDFYMYTYGQFTSYAEVSYNGRWVPNWISVFKSDSIAGNFTALNTNSKYAQTNTSSYRRSKITSSNIWDGEIISEVQLEDNDTYDMAGVLFRYNSTSDEGYVACLAFNDYSPFAAVYRINGGGSYTPLNTVNIPFYPIPMFFPGYNWRIKVTMYGTSIKAYYSAWGNDWVQIGEDIADTTYKSGAVGLWTAGAAAYFDNFRVRDYVSVEPSMGTTGESSYLEITTDAATLVRATSATLNGNCTGSMPTQYIAFWYGDDNPGVPTSMAKGSWDNYIAIEWEREQGDPFYKKVTALLPETLHFFVAGGNSTVGAFDCGEIGNFTTLALVMRRDIIIVH